MVLTRAQNQPGPDGILGDNPADADVDESADDIQNANNTDTPWVDQSQTYTSHSSHQVFLREYVINAASQPGLDRQAARWSCPPARTYCSTAPRRHDGSISTWASTKKQAATKLGLLLRRQGRDEHPDDRRRPVRQVHPGPAARSARST